MLDEFLDALDGVAYAVDLENRIVAVGRRRWDRFAAESAAPELRADSVIGRNLFEFVSGPDVRQAYHDLANRAISTGAPATTAARFDIPGMTRELRLSIAPLRLVDNSSGLLFHARIVGERAPPPLDVFDFHALLSALKQDPDLPIVAACSFCRRLRRPGPSDNEDWVPVADYYRLQGPYRARIGHGLCPDCDAVRFPDL